MVVHMIRLLCCKIYFSVILLRQEVIIMDKKLIERINELAKKKKTLGLNAEEQAEQKQLYAVYLSEIRAQFDSTLDNVSIKQEDGSVVPFKSAAKKKNTK